MSVIGPSFAAEVAVAGLSGLPFSWDADGVLLGDALSEADRARIEAVLAAHDPMQAAPPPVPERVTLADWREALIRWGRFDEVEAAVIAARDSGTVEGRIVWQRWEYANEVLRSWLMAHRTGFGFSAADVDESLRRAATLS